MKYDLHIHSCLSPCADDDMTPATIAGFAKLNGIDIIAVTDHNSAENLPAVKEACDAYGLILLPGIEANTAEEIHLLMYFKSVDDALAAGRRIYETLPPISADSSVWGNQLIMDCHDNVLKRVEYLLTAASSMDIYQMKELCGEYGGIAVPAHVDKDSYSLLSVLGFAPDDLDFGAYEVKMPEHKLKNLLDSGRLPGGKEILTSSDAHSILDISEYPRTLQKNSILRKLL